MKKERKFSRKACFLSVLALMAVALAMLVAGCKGSDTAPFGSVVSISTVGDPVILSTPSGTTKTQAYRVSVSDAAGLPMNGMAVKVSGNFLSGVEINFAGYPVSVGQLIELNGTTKDSGFFDFSITAPLVDPSGQQMQPPTAVNASAVSSGGILSAGTFTYAVTAIDLIGGETSQSGLATAITSTDNSSVQISWSAVTGAAGYNVYGRSAGSLGLLASVSNSTLLFTDTGSAVPGVAPPSSNTTFPVNIVQGSITATSGASVATKDISL